MSKFGVFQEQNILQEYKYEQTCVSLGAKTSLIICNIFKKSNIIIYFKNIKIYKVVLFKHRIVL